MEIKVGQIWYRNNANIKFCITQSDFSTSIIYSNGKVDCMPTIHFEDIAFKYYGLDTDKYEGDWISAIASPEFKGE